MKLLLKREYGKHLTRGTVFLNGKVLCKTLEPSLLHASNPCREGLFRLDFDCDEDSGWYLYFEAEDRRIKIKDNSATGFRDNIVPVTCFKKSIPKFTRLACRKLTDKLLQCMEEGEEVWLEIYSEFKPSKQKRWKLNPQNTLQGQEA
ncbi:hypothetical protein [Cognataquiflexum rubidum]|uniref:hypothetical protein n=1 Tax=Cognataquiflexum rubidum TaxID=2922273 RepID=UPI001F134948|nr:hypothetical protein [Cognataquiflexum rubidum]MCH6236826.1 hypothetical protein [Cognataquiflexum rubidum]